MNFIFSPLQQFDILPLFNFYFFGVDFSVTNETIMLVCIFGSFFIVQFSQLDEESFSHEC